MYLKHPPVKFECTKCGACCRQDSLLVTVTGRDIARIAIGLGLGPDEMIRALDFYLTQNVEPLKGLRDIPAIKTERGLAYIALKKLDNGDCVFLKDNLCMIHVIRPTVCRSFPFVFNDTGYEKTWGLSAMKEICPGLGSGPIIEISSLLQIADDVLEDLDIYKKFCEEWNSRERKPTAKRIIEQILSDPRFTV
jgi:Fe-S-cluster containining protein